MIKVKVCGMYDPFNVKELAEAKPDFIGFIFYPGSSRYVGKEPGMTLFNCVPQGIKRVGVFFNEANPTILDLSLRNGLEMIQLHGNESPVSCFRLKSSGLTIIKTFNISNDFSFELVKQYAPACDFFLFDTKSKIPGGSGKKFNWGKLDEYSLEKPFFLSGGIGPEDLDVIKSIENRGFFAVDINSCFETSPGIKDVRLVRTFINEIKNDQL
jgi:phosphoribosylanthranilate isomerase